ncbi:MAG: sigma-70 family RNA polymerase sigma factor [Oscillospiraceae bacterium]|jgi:RNA polymerase sporulation-specific sigma factor|nr:sigma-70 family RNA polymerase sigma factor [Oscillospiraceae bacterium]
MQKTVIPACNSALSDEQLVRLTRIGSPDAFNVLAARYFQTIRACAANYSNCGLETDDLTQEGLIGLLSAVRSYDAGFLASFGTFARLCVSRRMCSFARIALRKKRAPAAQTHSLDFFQAKDEPESPETTDPEAIFIRKQEREELCRIIGAVLSTFELKVLAGFLLGESYRQIARRLSASEKSVDNALWRVRKKLRTRLLKSAVA